MITITSIHVCKEKGDKNAECSVTATEKMQIKKVQGLQQIRLRGRGECQEYIPCLVRGLFKSLTH